MNDVEKLEKLLNYQVEHIHEHAGELEEWAEKAKAFEEVDVSAELLRAAQQMRGANEFLNQALEKLSQSRQI